MSYETNDKMVSHPDHYKSGKYEVIDIIDEFTKDLSGTEAVCTANAIKYILRWKKKNGIQDVKKAIWYLQHMVDKEEENEDDLEVLTCKECGYYNPVCCFTGNNVKPDQLMCACFEEKGEGEEVLVPDIDIDKVKEFYDIAGKPVDSEPKEVDMDKIMNRPTFIDVKEEKKFTNNTGEELNIPEFLEQPTNEVVHSCDDCAFKINNLGTPPCADCDLSLDPPSKWC